MIHKIQLHTQYHEQMIDITKQIEKIIVDENIQDGAVVVYSPHTTAGVTINENADKNVQSDLLRRLDEDFPWNMSEDKHLEGNSAAHVKTSMIGSSQVIIIYQGKLLLGRWQAVYFCEFDGPSDRTCLIKFLR